jgi:nitroreductase
MGAGVLPLEAWISKPRLVQASVQRRTQRLSSRAMLVEKMLVSEALRARHSVRAFLPTEVDEETLREIFSTAQLSPSWCNIQPWRAFVSRGETTAKLKTALTEAAMSSGPSPDFPWPAEYPEPYGQHRRACGKALYEAMGVERNDHEGRQGAWMRNFVAFDAPHIAIVAVDKRFGLYAALDIGCWLESVLLLAAARGLATCAQAALAVYPHAVRPILGIGDELGVLFGIGIGYEDTSAKANQCRTTRDPVENNITFVG